MIKPYFGDDHPDKVLPTADICFFNLELPNYSNVKVMEEWFLKAVHVCGDNLDADHIEM